MTAPAAPRSRLGCGLALLLTVAAGLASRRWPLPGLLAEYTGDALYTVAAFWGLAWLRPGASRRRLALGAALASSLVEVSQALPWAWLADLRTTWVGALVLGQGFQGADLVAYAVGAALAAGLDRLVFRPAGTNPGQGLTPPDGSSR